MQYKVISPINYNGVRFVTGDSIDLSEQDAAKLLEGGAIEPMRRPFSCGELTLKLNHGA